MSQYSEMQERYDSFFGLNSTNSTAWQSTLKVVDGRPLEGYRQFETYADASTLVGGNYISIIGERMYDVYPGAVISVVNDSTEGNNGLYHVIYNDEYTGDQENESMYKLEKIYSASEVDELISQAGGTIDFFDIDNSSVGKRLVYFTGTDSSVNGHNDSSLYFTPFIAYDPTDGTLFSPTVAQASDERLKNIIEPINVDLDTLNDIQKIRFTWKKEENGKVNIGVVAQSVERVFPELVIENPDTGYKNVNYEGLSVVALAAVDKLHTEVKNLEERLYQLESRMNNI